MSSSDASLVALDDITAPLEDLDSIEMGNTQARDSGRLFIRTKRKSRRRTGEKVECQIEDVEREVVENCEEIK